MIIETQWGRWTASARSADLDLLVPFLEALASALRFGLPVPAMLDGMLRDRGPTASVLVRSGKWRRRLTRISADLRQGLPLGAVLSHRLGRLLPRHYRLALEQADRDATIQRLVPIVTESLRRSASAAQEWRQALVYPVIQFCTILGIATFMAVFLFPKWFCVLNEFSTFATEFSSSPGSVPRGAPPATQALTLASHAIRWFWVLLPQAVVLAAAAWGVVVLARLGPRLRTWIELPLLHIPWFGPQLRRVALLDFVQGIGVYLASGEDLPRAAERSLETNRSPWLSRHARSFVRELNTGSNSWADAWERLHLGTPLHDWVLQSAASREAPAEGFALLAEWLAEDIRRTTEALQLWSETSGILFNCALIAPVIWAMFASLVHVLVSVMESI